MSYAKKDDQVAWGNHGTFLVLADGLSFEQGPGLEIQAIELAPGDALGMVPGDTRKVKAWECSVIPRPRFSFISGIDPAYADSTVVWARGEDGKITVLSVKKRTIKGDPDENGE